jgi:S-formylglutathione hydrolase FrmB
MALLGAPLIVVLALAAVSIPVATVLVWSRVRGPAIARNGTRVGMLLAGQLATVLLAAAVANDYGQFYASWGDLVGASAAPASLRYYGAGATPASRSGSRTGASALPALSGQAAATGATGQLRVIGDSSWSSPSQWSTRGRLESVVITGSGSRLSTQAYVYLPPQYFWRSWAHRRMHAVEVLTGYPGSVTSLLTRMNYPQMALTALQRHRTTPMVYVLADSTVAAPRDTECTDVPNGPQVQTFLSEEVPSAVAGALRVHRRDWGIIGTSTGGYCAAKILMNHDAVFRAGVSLSGYFYARQDMTTGSLWGGSLRIQHLNDPEWMLAHHPAPPVSLFIGVGKQETRRDGYPDAVRFLREVRPPMRVTAMIEPQGGHNYRTWNREIPVALHWLSARLAGG